MFVNIWYYSYSHSPDMPAVEAIVEENPVVKAPEGEPTSLTCKSMSYPRSTSGDVLWFFEDDDVRYVRYGNSMGVMNLASVESLNYTLSHLENDRDVSAYSGGKRLSSRAQLVCFLTRSKRNIRIDA